MRINNNSADSCELVNLEVSFLCCSSLSGLVAVVLTECDDDPRTSVFNPDLSWVSFISPLILLVLFHLLIYEVKTLLRPQVSSRPTLIRILNIITNHYQV